MSRLLQCNCGEGMSISEASAGQNLTCKQCGEVVQVPPLRELRLLPAVESKSQLIQSTAEFSLAKICFLGGLLIMALGGVMALTFSPVLAGFSVLGLFLFVGGWISG